MVSSVPRLRVSFPHARGGRPFVRSGTKVAMRSLSLSVVRSTAVEGGRWKVCPGESRDPGCPRLDEAVAYGGPNFHTGLINFADDHRVFVEEQGTLVGTVPTPCRKVGRKSLLVLMLSRHRSSNVRCFLFFLFFSRRRGVQTTKVISFMFCRTIAWFGFVEGKKTRGYNFTASFFCGGGERANDSWFWYSVIVMFPRIARRGGWGEQGLPG